MSIKSILVPIADASGAESVLPLALALAERLGARLTAMHAAPDPSTSLPILADAPAVGVVDQLITAMEQQSARVAEQTHETFRSACSAFGVSPVADFGEVGFAARYVTATGSEETLTARFGRLHDLVAVPCPRGNDPALTTALGAALLETGRPVLIAPPVAPQSVATRIVAAWNGSIEAARALSASAALAAPEASVVVVMVGEADPAVPTADDAVAYLASHGLAAEAAQLSADGRTVAEALLVEADRRQADLLVMGAYSHSRLRETILGGVTRDVLANLDLPVLMAH